MDYTQIILKPVLSEKSTLAKEENNQVVFIVNPRAGKLEIKKAVEDAFKVKVDEVRVVNKKAGVKTRQGRTVGRVSGYKKAYVTLAEGQKIEIIEGV